MTIDEKKKRILELVELLNEARYTYEQENREIMSNFEYDKLYDELLALEEETDMVLSNSPTINVGFEVLSELPKEKHASPMLSLNKTKDVEELKSWLGDKEGLLSWKMDGLTVVLTYEGGELAKAVTRGNGEIGEVITQNAKAFSNVPLKISHKGKLILRGEAVITYSDFERINSKIEDVENKYKNPRNLCSGSVRQLDSKITKERNVKFYAFSLVEAYGVEFTRRSEQFAWLAAEGFTVVEHVLVFDIAEDVKKFAAKVASNDFPSDGLVLCYDDIEYGRSLGRTAKFPRDAIAFKWKDEVAETTLREIEWSASRTGLINPVAIFDPVELEGTTVSRASVHNVSILKELKLGIGDRIEVYKANMIIPQIARNITGSGNLEIPTLCPVCGGKTEVRADNEAESLYCLNPDCPAKQLKSFSHFVSRDAMNVDGLSEMTLEKLVDRGFVKEFADIFKLSRYKDEIVEMDGFGEKSYENLIMAIETASHTTEARLLYALGIANIGASNAKLIAKEAAKLAKEAGVSTWEKLEGMNALELLSIDGVGDVMAESYTKYFENKEKLAELLSKLTFEEQEESNVEQSLEGLTFVITGSVEHFANRKELQELIESKGGKAAGSVSAKTSYLINNDSTSGSSKNKSAKALGVPIITEDEFIAMFVNDK